MITKTERGFSIEHFTDLYRQPCSIQKSSLATIDAIWLGVDSEIDFNTGELLGPNQRMHLNREQVKQLIPLLQKFVDTGNIE